MVVPSSKQPKRTFSLSYLDPGTIVIKVRSVELTLQPHPKKLTLLASWGPFGPQSCHGLPKHESVNING